MIVLQNVYTKDIRFRWHFFVQQKKELLLVMKECQPQRKLFTRTRDLYSNVNMYVVIKV